ncbi:hypothetical protein DXG01_003589 [Tephrocybe rancida]|nr:hypothetical protein DXG01_003589 [Tephrocybe rancida]
MEKGQETADPPAGTDPSWVSMGRATWVLNPVEHDAHVASGYDSSLLGPAGDGWYSPLASSRASSPTPALPFDEMSPDVSDIPHLPTSAYPYHFQLPPLGFGGFVAPNVDEINAGDCRATPRE